MLTIQIEHPIRSYESWKVAFDADPIDRKGSGVRAYRVLQPFDDPHRIVVELDVDDSATAEVVSTKLRALWQTPRAASVLADEAPVVRLLNGVEQKEL